MRMLLDKLFFINTGRRIQLMVANIFHYAIEEIPTKDLGIPLFLGGMIDSLWDPIVERFLKKLAS